MEDNRLDQLLGETLKLMSESGVTLVCDPAAIGKFAANYHQRMLPLMPALDAPLITDNQMLIEAAVQKAVAETVQATVKSTIESMLVLQTGPRTSKVLTLMNAGKKTSISLPAALYARIEAIVGAKQVVALSNSFASTRPDEDTPLSPWIQQNLENWLLLKSLESDSTDHHHKH